MEEFYKLLTDLKLKLFGKKKKENTGDIGLEKSVPDILQQMEDLLYSEGFKIEDYKDCGVYYSNGYWYKSNGKGKFLFLGKDAMFADEQNFKA